MTKTKKHHDGAGVDDDLGGGEELCAQRPVEDGERHHDDDQRESAVDGMALQEEIQCSCDGQRAKDDEECELHDVPRVPSWISLNVQDRLKQSRRLFGLSADCKTACCVFRAANCAKR